ncbi:MAG: hypothetical protein F6K31_31200 [Symploca sp. SIO2G7]|nr:hypothetical protein [Symploca sp. SIO2G7]
MNNRSPNHQRSPVKILKQVGRSRFGTITPWSLLILALMLHTVVGVLLVVFSPPFWVWPLAFGGTFLQTVVAAGPRALASLKGLPIWLFRLVTYLGTAMSVVALAVAVGYGGTNNIDEIQFARTGLLLVLVNLGVLGLTAICSLLIAQVGDRLLTVMGRIRCSSYILSFCFLGLFLGGALGLAIAS